MENETEQGNLEGLVIPTTVTKAEIMWTLKSVVAHIPYRTCLDLPKLFQAMFPASDIASGFTLSKTKCAYVVYKMCQGIKQEI